MIGLRPSTSVVISTLFIAGLLFVLSVPLVLGTVPPNSAYGFRTATTMSNPDVWYKANRFCGEASMVCAVVMVVSIAVYFFFISRVSMPSTLTTRLGLAVEFVPLVALLLVLLTYNSMLASHLRR